MNNMTIQFKGTNSSSVEKKDNPGFFKKVGAGTVGAVAAGVAQTAMVYPAAKGFMSKVIKINHGITKDEVAILNKAGDEILIKSGLDKKGVKIFRKLSKGMKEALAAIDKKFNKIPAKNKILRKIRIILKNTNPFRVAGRGRNAFFGVFSNEILAVDKMAVSQFHEIGHAMNKFSKGGRLLQNIRLDFLKKIKYKKVPFVGMVAGTIASTIGLVSIFKNKKAEGEQPVGFWDKTTTFIKNNVGKLTFITMLPMVAEEALASYKGEKAVKGLIDKGLFKKIKTSNRFALATYATLAVAAGVAAMIGNNIRDKIAQPNLNKA